MPIFKRPHDSSSDTEPAIGRTSLWSASKFSWRQYSLVAAGLLILAGGIVLFAASPASIRNANVPNPNTSGALIASNCAPVASASDGTMVWYSKNSQGVWDAYIGNDNCQGSPLLPAYDGNRGPADITSDGRYVLLTTAVGTDKTLADSSPGQGSGNEIQLYDRQTGTLSTLLPGGTASQRGVIWPKFNSNDTKIVWSQFLQTGVAAGDIGSGRWALNVADVDLATGTLSNDVSYQTPDGQPAFYEAYGWIPNTNNLIFMSTTNHTAPAFHNAQMYTLPDTLSPSATPTRLSPPINSVVTGRAPASDFNEFAHFAPNDPNTMYTSIDANTDGGDDLYAYNLTTQDSTGLLGQPTRISYFGGQPGTYGLAIKAVPGWPQPTYTVVTTMAWDNGSWDAATCPDILCSKVNAWRITLH
jgi:hypothetical protein